jgi:proline racemase
MQFAWPARNQIRHLHALANPREHRQRLVVGCMPKASGHTMKNIRDLLREKEAELQQLEKEVEALRLAASLLNPEGSSAAADAMVPPASPKSSASVLSFEERTLATPVSGTTVSRQFP